MALCIVPGSHRERLADVALQDHLLIHRSETADVWVKAGCGTVDWIDTPESFVAVEGWVWVRSSTSPAARLARHLAEHGFRGTPYIAGRYRFVVVDRRRHQIWLGTDPERQWTWHQWSLSDGSFWMGSDIRLTPGGRGVELAKPWMTSYVTSGALPPSARGGPPSEVAAVLLGYDVEEKYPLTPASDHRSPDPAHSRAETFVGEAALSRRIQSLARLGPLNACFTDGSPVSFLAIAMAVRLGLGQPILYYPSSLSADSTARVGELSRFLATRAEPLPSPSLPSLDIMRSALSAWDYPWASSWSWAVTLMSRPLFGWRMAALCSPPYTYAPLPSGVLAPFANGPVTRAAGLALLTHWLPSSLLPTEPSAPPPAWPSPAWNQAGWAAAAASSAQWARRFDPMGLGNQGLMRWIQDAARGDGDASDKLMRLVAVAAWAQTAPSEDKGPPQLFTYACDGQNEKD